MLGTTCSTQHHRTAVVLSVAGGGALLGALVLLHYHRKNSDRRDVALEKQRSGGCVVKRRVTDNTDAPFLHQRPQDSQYYCVDDKDSSGALQQKHPYAELIAELQTKPFDHGGSSNLRRPAALQETEYTWIDTPVALRTLKQTLQHATRIALDCEHNALRSYLGITCLVQIAVDGVGDFLIDSLALHSHMHELADIFANPAICKVLHGGENDVLWLQRDFRLYLVNVHDTQKLASAAGFERMSLSHLLQEVCGIQVDKSYQSSDWTMRPLPPQLIAYARQDVHYLLHLHDCLFQMVCKRDAGDELLKEAHRRSQAVSLLLYSKPLHEPSVQGATIALLRRYLQGKGGKALRGGDVVRDCVHALCKWRDDIARCVDEGVQYVLPDEAVLALASGGRLHGHAELITTISSALPRSELNGRFGHCNQASEVSWVLIRHADELLGLLSRAQQGELPWAEVDMLQLASGGNKQSSRKAAKKAQADVRERLVHKFSAKSPVYENCRMLSQDGELLCHCDRRKMRWYLERGLATAVSDQENTIQLNFQHQNTGKADASNRFYATSKSNHCVVCGEAGHYLRYRVVPSCYRRHFPLHLKTHRSHDIVLVCISCHEAAQVVADEVKRELAAEHGIPLNPPPLAPPVPSTISSVDNEGVNAGGTAAGDQSGQEEMGVHPYNARRAAQALSKNGDAMPAARREELEAVIKQYLGRPKAGDDSPGLRPGDLDAALVAGVSRRRQKKMLQRYGRTAAGMGESSEGEIADGNGANEGGVESTGRYAPSSRSEEKDQWGHGWHGSRVVAGILERGGETELLNLIRRFRERFVERLAPRFMPPGWEVDHSAAREFGKHSIYYGQPS